jgi:hypothetical protein
MRGHRRYLRQALFWLSAVALALGAILFSGNAWEPSVARNTATTSAPGIVAAPMPTGAQRAGLRSAAEAFLRHFFRYEVGRIGGTGVKGLRSTATETFASELLRQPPRIIGRPPLPARLERLSLEILSVSPLRAWVSGFARRDGARERFSFLFEVTEGSWRASGPGP